MPAVSFPLRRGRIFEETVSPPGSVDQSGSPGTFLDIPFQADSFNWTPAEPLNPTNVVQQIKHGMEDHVLGPRSAVVNMTLPLHGSGLAGSSVTASADEDDNALMRLMKIGMGGIFGGNLGSDVATANTAETFTLTSAAGFSVGGAAGWVNPAGQLEIAPIESITGAIIVLKIEFSAAPAMSDAIFSATTIFLDDGGSYAQFLVEGANTEDFWSIRGGQLSSLAIANPLGELPTITFSWLCSEWARLGAGTIAGATYSNHQPFKFNGGAFLAQVVATATRQTISTPSVTITPNLAYSAVTSQDGTQTILDWVQTHGSPVVQGEFQTYFGVDTPTIWYTAWSASTAYLLALQIGTANSRGVLIEIPNSQIGPVSAGIDIDGITGLTVPYQGRHDTDATDQSTPIRTSPLKFHFIN